MNIHTFHYFLYIFSNFCQLIIQSLTEKGYKNFHTNFVMYLSLLIQLCNVNATNSKNF